MDQQQLQALLQSGDVDLIRRVLKHGDAALAPATPPRPPPPPSRYLSAEHLILPLDNGLTLRLVSSRVMGKVLWPCAQQIRT